MRRVNDKVENIVVDVQIFLRGREEPIMVEGISLGAWDSFKQAEKEGAPNGDSFHKRNIFGKSAGVCSEDIVAWKVFDKRSKNAQ